MVLIISILCLLSIDWSIKKPTKRFFLKGFSKHQLSVLNIGLNINLNLNVIKKAKFLFFIYIFFFHFWVLFFVIFFWFVLFFYLFYKNVFVKTVYFFFVQMIKIPIIDFCMLIVYCVWHMFHYIPGSHFFLSGLKYFVFI